MLHSHARSLALLTVCLVGVAVVRMLPRFLDGVATTAEQKARDEVAQRLGAQSGAEASDAHIDAWIAAHAAEHDNRVAELVESFKREHRFQGDDGREHPYLGDLDSYLWLRLARNYLRHGSVCDRIVDGVCRDDLAPAPVGREQLYARSLHTAAIVGLHRLITLFSPDFPLSSTSYYVPVIVGLLGVIPAFLLGRRFGGDVGAVVAALACGTNPAFMIRSVGSDNDVWNIVLPLYVVWACVESLAASTLRARLAYAAAAGVFVALHAAVWSGWLFAHVVASVGLAATVAYAALRYAMQHRDLRLWRDQVTAAIVVSAATYLVVASIAVLVVDPNAEVVRRLPQLFDAFRKSTPAAATAAPDLENIVWPSHFSSVAELRQMQNINPASYGANVPLLLFGFVGAALLALPLRRWQWWHLAAFAAGAAVLGYVYSVPESTRTQVPLLLLPAALALAAVTFGRRSDDYSERGALVLMAWLAGAYVLGARSNRFVMFLAPPVAVGLAVCADRVRELVLSYAGTRLGPRAIAAVSCAIVGLFLAYPLQRGYVMARSQLPQMNDAWWDTLSDLRRTAPPDSIVNGWWHDGHWITYGAERAVIADGASLQTHVPYWFTRALLTSDEAHSVGLLRMLDCGSDATPYPEGVLGAYGKLRAQGLGVFAAQALVDKLAAVDRDAAAAELGRQGLSPDAVADVLRSTHCESPTAFLVLSSRLAKTAGWAVGQWDFRRAFATNWAASLPREDGVRTLVRDAGYTDSEARELYRKVPRGDSDTAHAFIAPELGYLTKDWVPCVPDDTGSTRMCFLAAKVSNAAQVLEGFEYNPRSPAGGRLRIKHQRGGKPSYTYRTPGTIFITGPQRLEETRPPAATDPGIAVLVDTVGHRLLLAEAVLLRSTFTKLMYLDGRYLQRFEKVQERAAYTGESIVTFRVRRD